MKIVKNSCYGGFGLSDKACERMIELGYIGLKKISGEPSFGGSYLREDDIPRNHPLLIQVVEELEEDANGHCAELEIIEIPDDIDWVIEEYDGNEWISERHRTWG